MRVCVVIPFILDVRFVDIPRSHRRKVTQNFSTFAVLALIFLGEGFRFSFPLSIE